MHEDTLKTIDCFDEVKNLLLVSGLFQFAFNALPSYLSLIIEFLSSFTLRSINYDNDNSYFLMRFKLGGRDRFMTYQEFDTLFGFGHEDMFKPLLIGLEIPFGMISCLLKLHLFSSVTLNLLTSNPRLFGISIALSPTPSMQELCLIR